MPTQRITVTLLIVSLIINIALAVFMGMDSVSTRHMVDTALIEASEQSFRMQSEILADLESKDPARIETCKASLRAGIALQSGKSYRVRTAPKGQPAQTLQ